MARIPPDFDAHPAGYEDANDRGLNRAVCRYVVDGDTADFFVDLGWLQYGYVTVRFYDVDTPELRGTTGAEREAAFAAKARVQALLLDKPVLLKTYKDATTFGRFVASIWFTASDDGTFPAFENTFRLDPDDDTVWISIADVLKHEGLLKSAFH